MRIKNKTQPNIIPDPVECVVVFFMLNASTGLVCLFAFFDKYRYISKK